MQKSFPAQTAVQYGRQELYGFESRLYIGRRLFAGEDPGQPGADDADDVVCGFFAVQIVAMLDPVDEDTCQGLCVEFCQIFPEGRLQLLAADLLDTAQQFRRNRDKVTVEKAAQLIAPQGIVGAVDEVIVLLHIVHDEKECFPVMDRQVELADDIDGFLCT